MRFLLILALLSASCVTTPEFTSCTPTQPIDDYDVEYCGQPPPLSSLSLYLAAFEQQWALETDFPQDPEAIHRAFNSLKLHWQPNMFLRPGDPRRLLGLTYAKENGSIRVFIYVSTEFMDLAPSSLGHELIHVAYGAIDGDMRADHLTGGPRWPASHALFLKRVNDRYQASKSL